MKKMTILVYVFLISGALLATSFAQEGQPSGQQVAPAAQAEKPAAAVKKQTPRAKRVKKTLNKPAAETAAKAGGQGTVQIATRTAEVPLAQVNAATAAPAAVSEAVKPKPGTLSSCPHCFQPLVAGYSGILAELNPWMEEMDVRAADLDHKLSAIQKRINEKDSAIENAKLGTDKKAMKAAVKSLNKEHKLLEKEYDKASEEKDAFYEKFSKEIEKKTEHYNKIMGSKLKETLSAASQ